MRFKTFYKSFFFFIQCYKQLNLALNNNNFIYIIGYKYIILNKTLYNNYNKEEECQCLICSFITSSCDISIKFV